MGNSRIVQNDQMANGDVWSMELSGTERLSHRLRCGETILDWLKYEMRMVRRRKGELFDIVL